jgi:hypothetical protein
MYARLLCHAVISHIPDDAIPDVFHDLILKYEIVGIGAGSTMRASYPVADLRSTGILRSILGARIPAVRSPAVSDEE